MRGKKISVIIPVYNCKRYLRCCLDSMRAQTYPEVEVIVVDDGSTDGSREICDEYAAEYKNIYVIHQENGGPGLARNAGLSRASGEYFTFVDGDDYVSKHYLEIMSGFLEKYDADIAEVGNVYLQPIRTTFSKCEEDVLVIEGTSALMKDYFSSAPQLRNTVWGRLYRSDKLRQIQFAEHSIGEDYEYTRSILASSKKLVKCRRCLYAYRCYQNSLTRTGFNRNNFDVVEIDYNNLLYLNTVEDIGDFWKEKICGFEDTCLEVLRKMALDRVENCFPEEVEKLKVTYTNVLAMAEEKNVGMGSELPDALENLPLWSDKYRRSFRKTAGIRACKKAIYRLASIFKNTIMYEYKFDD